MIKQVQIFYNVSYASDLHLQIRTLFFSQKTPIISTIGIFFCRFYRGSEIGSTSMVSFLIDKKDIATMLYKSAGFQKWRFTLEQNIYKH